MQWICAKQPRRAPWSPMTSWSRWSRRRPAARAIDLTSNVLQQFGAQIRSVITETLTEYGVENAAVTAVDKGALDCTIRARVTAALFRSAGSAAYRWEVK